MLLVKGTYTKKCDIKKVIKKVYLHNFETILRQELQKLGLPAANKHQETDVPNWLKWTLNCLF